MKQSIRISVLKPTWLLGVAGLIALGIFAFQARSLWSTAQAAGVLTITSNTGTYAIYDANKPETQSPGVLQAEIRVCNTGTTPLTDVVVYIGNGTTVGAFPNSTPSGYPLKLLDQTVNGDVSDGTRELGTLAADQCIAVFWSIDYPNPAIDISGTKAGFTVWGTGFDSSSSTTVTGSVYDEVVLRNQTSASSNKIITQAPGYTVSPAGPYTQGEQFKVCYTGIDFGVVGAGEDPDDKGPLPSVNDIWYQPVGVSGGYNPDDFRLVKTEVNLQSNRSQCSGQIYSYTDISYFDQIDSGDWDGNGVVEACSGNSQQITGQYCYTFIALDDGITTLYPYQQASSGTQQKFNGDYGSVTLTVTTNDSCSIGLTKGASPDPVQPGETLTYTVNYTNLKNNLVGYYPGNTLAVVDSIPSGTTYSAGSASCPTGVSCTIFYSNNNGNTWTTAEPVTGVNKLKFVLNEPVPANGTDSVSYAVIVDPDPNETYTGVSAAAASSNFSGAQCGVSNTVTTTPVTLSFFQASQAGEVLVVDWTTSRETGNVGFNLYTETGNGRQRLNSELIPSKGISSLKPLDYHFELTGFTGGTIYIEDVDLFNRTRQHGPFELGKAYGKRADLAPVDWAGIGAGHAKQAEARSAERKAATSARLKQAGSTTTTEAMSTSAVTAQGVSNGAVVNLLVEQDGLYRLTYQDLLNAGYDFNGVSASAIALTNRSLPVPIYVSSVKGVFGPTSFIEFYGKAVDSLYTTTNVYTLHVDSSKAARVAVDTTKPNTRLAPAAYYMETVKVENDRYYSESSPSGDPWYDADMLVSKTAMTWNFTVDVKNYVAGAAPASLAVGLFGYTDFAQAPDHHMVVGFNNTDLVEDVFDGSTNRPINVQLPAGLLKEGINTVNIRLPGDIGVDYDMIGLDQYSVTYPRAFLAQAGRLKFEGSNPVYQVNGLPETAVVVYRENANGLVRLGSVSVSGANGVYSAKFNGSTTPATFLVSAASALLKPAFEPVAASADIKSGGAQYLVISHPDFIAGLAPLVQARQAQDLAVKVVNVEDVYTQFSGGVFDPQAIKDYIAFAAQNLGTQYVLLVGGDTFDYFNRLGLGSMSFIPSLYAATDVLIQYAPADSLYTDLDNDGVQDIPIGRFPVRTTAELERMVKKTLEYGASPNPGTSIFSADRSFGADSDAMAVQLPEGWSKAYAYLDQLKVTEARELLVNTLNSGVALTNFVGHSDDWEWSFDYLFTIYDAQALTNTGKPTVVNQYACWSNYYVNPYYDNLANEFLVLGDRGAAAVLGVTGMSDSGNARTFGELLTGKLAQPGMPLGLAIQNAKDELALVQPGARDVLLGWTLLGDPYLKVQP